MADDAPVNEVDPRFPSGKWVGFFTYHGRHEKSHMELLLTFASGVMTGEGRDVVGEFTIKGRYHTDDGACNFTKQYVSKHSVSYSGFNEGKGIWGTWLLVGHKGGFHIWPEAMGDPSLDALTAEADVPAPPPYEDPVTDDELVPAAA